MSKKTSGLAYRLGSSLINHILEKKLYSRYDTIRIAHHAACYCQRNLNAQTCSSSTEQCVNVHKTLFRFRTYLRADTHVYAARAHMHTRTGRAYFIGSRFHSVMCSARIYYSDRFVLECATPLISSTVDVWVCVSVSSTYEFYSPRPPPLRCVCVYVCVYICVCVRIPWKQNCCVGSLFGRRVWYIWNSSPLSLYLSDTPMCRTLFISYYDKCI